MRLGNGRWETAKFNNRLQVTELGLGNSATDASVWKTNYAYGEIDSNGDVDTTKNTGNIARQTLTVPGTSFVQSYKYDSLYRLTEAVEKTDTTTNWSQEFSYDRYGNRIGIDQAIGLLTLNTTPTVDANTNRFNPSQGFSYDKNGNVVNDVDPLSSLTRQFIFNGDNKQVEVKKDGITIGRYYYDGEGKRVKKVTDTETTVFVYSSGKLIAEYSTQLSTTPSVAYTTTDHLGTPRIISDELGQVKARRDFMPFGEELYMNIGGRTGNAGLKYSSSEDDVRQKFTGYQKDNETGLDFAEARMYANNYGRFTAVDPLLASGRSANPQSFNRHIYTSNNPIVRTDPTGLDWYQTPTGNAKRPYTYKWFDEDPRGDWSAVKFDPLANFYEVQDAVSPEGNELGTIYLHRYTNDHISADQYGGIMRVAYALQNYSVAHIKGATNFGISAINSPLHVPIITPLPQTSLSNIFGFGNFVDRYEYNGVMQNGLGYGTEATATIGSLYLGFRGTTSLSSESISATSKLPTLIIDYNKYPDLALNIAHAQKAGHPKILTWGGNASNRTEALKGIPKILSRDEYPFASTLEGGRGSWVGHIPKWQNDAQGGIMTSFKHANKLKSGDKYVVCVINVPGC